MRASLRPVGERGRAPVADHVARISFAVRHPVVTRARRERCRPDATTGPTFAPSCEPQPAGIVGSSAFANNCCRALKTAQTADARETEGAAARRPAVTARSARTLADSARASRPLMTEISLRFEPPFARIVLDRPERRNAITRAMWRALPAIRAAIEARDDLLVALVEGEGAHFSAGADIAELGDIYRDAAATRDLWRRDPGRPQGAHGPRPPDHRGHPRRRHRRRAWAGAGLRSEVLRRRRASRDHPARNSASSMAMPRRAG